MEVPAHSDPRWKSVLTTDKDYGLKFLATKILLSRLKMRCAQANSPIEIAGAIKELHGFFVKNQKLPLAVADLKVLMGGN